MRAPVEKRSGLACPAFLPAGSELQVQTKSESRLRPWPPQGFNLTKECELPRILKRQGRMS